MGWNLVEQWAQDKQCFEAQRYGRCNCRSRKGNPCERHQAVQQACQAISEGQASKLTLEEILKHVGNYRCNESRWGKHCNHRGCIRAEEIIDWLTELLQQQEAA